MWCTNSLTFNNCTFCPHCIYVFCIYLRTNSDLYLLQHKLIGFYNRDEKCLPRGTNWVFNQSSLRFVFKGLNSQRASGFIKQQRTPLSRLCRAATFYINSKIVFLAFQISVRKNMASYTTRIAAELFPSLSIWELDTISSLRNVYFVNWNRETDFLLFSP